MKVKFIWGLGGVGKTHLCLREAVQMARTGKVLMMTLDPSQRLFHLLNIEPKPGKTSTEVDGAKFDIKRVEPARLLDALDESRTTSPSLKAFYEKMAAGLQEFNHYLALIQLSQEIERSEYDVVIVDTPPLVEASGLQRSLFHLKAFFETSLVQLALKSTRFSFIHFSIKRIFDLSRLFVGQKATDRVFELFDWMTSRRERFERAAHFLDKLVFSHSTEHIFILTPDSEIKKIQLMKDLFKEARQKSFLVNRSVWDFPDDATRPDPFVDEMLSLKSRESKLLKALERELTKPKISRLPFLLMGDDTTEELNDFVRLSLRTYESI